MDNGDARDLRVIWREHGRGREGVTLAGSMAGSSVSLAVPASVFLVLLLLAPDSSPSAILAELDALGMTASC
jgi:hypothetical protein